MAMIALREPELVERLVEVAAYEETSPETLLDTAASHLLDQRARQKIHAETEVFKAMHGDLVQQYLEEFVAIHGSEVVDHDSDFNTLYHRIRARYGRIPVMIRQVKEQPDRELVIRRPRLEPLE